jgi:hypothetical protein
MTSPESLHQLNSFISQVEARLGKKLNEKQADNLFAAAELIINSIYAGTILDSKSKDML